MAFNDDFNFSTGRHRRRQRFQVRSSQGLWLRFGRDFTEPAPGHLTESAPADSLAMLVQTIDKRRCSFIENLIKSGTDINGALIYAASRGYKTAVSNLLVTGTSVNTVDDDGDSPLMVAARKGMKSALRL